MSGGKPSKEEVKELLEAHQINFIRLIFTDILGIPKNVTIPISQLDKALDGEIGFDGSSIEGFARIEESDMFLLPDPSTLYILPWGSPGRDKEAVLICDIYKPDGTRFQGDPRYVLQKVTEKAEKMGYEMMVGVEAEFFVFGRYEVESLAGGIKVTRPSTSLLDRGGYFDMLSVDAGEELKKEIILSLEDMGFNVETGHHEVAPSQHEIDFKYADALTTADRLILFKLVVKTLALKRGLHATFMPKPIAGINGSGMHTHQSLITLDGKNAFYSPEGKIYNLSDIALSYIAGIMDHAKGMTAITNPLVNSYKRLVPGYEAPVYITWSRYNRSPLIRIPASDPENTRIELRSPDPSCNPYLALAVMLASGLDGIERKLIPPEPISDNIFILTPEERARRGIESLPSDLLEALNELRKDKLLRDILGEHIYTSFMRAKLMEWDSYRQQVTRWELERYLEIY